MAAAAAFVLTFVRPAGFTGMSSLGYALLVAVVVVVLGVPPLIMYALLSRNITNSLAMGAVKG